MRQFAVLSAIFLTFTCLAADMGSTPTLRPERTGDLTRLWVDAVGIDGTVRSVLLRETTAAVSPVVTGRDPAGRAAFVRWSEAGEPWSSYSLDGGSNWSGARPLRVELRLHAGAVGPAERMPGAAPGLSLPPDARLHIVQFRTVSLPQWRLALEEAGVEVLAFFPNNGHLIRLDPNLLTAVASMDFVERVERYHPSYRLEAELLEWLDSQDDGPDRMRLRVVAFEWGGPGRSRIADTARELGAEIAAFWPNGHVIELWLDREQLRQVASHDDVMWIDRWGPPEHDMDVVREDAGTNWVEDNFGYCGQGVRGEVLDSGIQSDHPDFDGILLHGPTDVTSHGTSTYGIVFGNGDRDGDGDLQATGHLPCAEQGIFADHGSMGDRFAHTQELRQAPYFASFQSNSWGDPRTTQYTSVSQEMDDIIWRLDVAILQSQSNAGNQDSRPQAWAKNIIAVGGIKHKNTIDPADDQWTAGGSIGPAADGRIKPDISYWYDDIYTTTTGGGYTAGFGGTSAATPEAAGVLGLIVQMWAANVWGTNPQGATVFEKQPHFATIKALMINNAQQYPFVGEADDLTRMHQGWGRPSARLARERAARSFVIDQELPLDLAAPISTYAVEVLPGEPELKITMVYPDPPGTASATLHRINDLDLTVTSPSGLLYHGNVGLDVGTESVPDGSPNGVDTVENVFVVSPEPGTWSVEVEAVEINQDANLETAEDDVTYALVVTGGAGSACTPPVSSLTVDPSPGRVGEEIRFDSSAAGGAGGPFSYRWDFDADGAADSTEEDPVHVYRRPYDGPVTLRVRDIESCPEEIDQAVIVTGPDLRFDSWFELTELDGNANGAVDPGEVWDFRINLRNDGNETAVGVAAAIEADPSNPGTVIMLQSRSSFPDVAVGASQPSNQVFRFKVGSDFTCGQDALFTLRQLTSTDPANTYPDEIAVVRILVGGAGPPIRFYIEGWEQGSNGWGSQGGGEWQFEAPQGLGGQQVFPGQTPGPDPAAAFEGTSVMGNDLTGQGLRLGNYEDGTDTAVFSPSIDASGAVDVELRFARWLNLDSADTASLDISPDGVNWTNLFSTTGPFIEQAWTQHSFDVSEVADRERLFRMRFSLTADAVLVQGGWNVDGLELLGVTKESCEPFSQSLPGEAVGLTVGKGAPGDLELSWAGDCGGGTTFGVYRGDLTSGYSSIAQEPGRCAVAGTVTTVPAGSGNADFFLVVPNEGSTEGSYGVNSSAPRQAAAVACLPQGQLAPCAP